MKEFYLRLIVTFLCGGLTGCAYFNTAFRTYDNENNSVMVDVKQRAIISKTIYKDGKHKRSAICAEPSPDAMSAYAAELAGSMTTPQQIKGEFAAAFQEGAGFVGLRTQSIQLLRDSMYRLCEAYMNDAISGERYDLLARRYQKNMVALLAIEQLTGTVKVAPIIINTQGSASVAQTIDQLLEAQQRLYKDRASINLEIADLNKKIEEYQTQLDKAAGSEKTDLEIKKKAAGEQVGELNSRLTTVDTVLKQLDEAIKAPGSTATKGFTNSYVGSEAPKERSDAAIAAVAKSVELIVNKIIEGDDLIEMCVTFYSKAIVDEPNPFEHYKQGRLNELCEAVLEVESEQWNRKRDLMMR